MLSRKHDQVMRLALDIADKDPRGKWRQKRTYKKPVEKEVSGVLITLLLG